MPARGRKKIMNTNQTPPPSGLASPSCSPCRVWRRRTKGWKMPENTVSVCRPGKFGNPFTAQGCRDAGFSGTDEVIQARCVETFRVWVSTNHWRENWSGEESRLARQAIIDGLPDLRGKNLACFCKPGTPCHADVLLGLANGKLSEPAGGEAVD